MNKPQFIQLANKNGSVIYVNPALIVAMVPAIGTTSLFYAGDDSACLTTAQTVPEILTAIARL